MKAIILVLATTFFLYGADATLEIVKEVGSPLSVAVESEGARQATLDRQIAQMIEADLRVSGFFNVVSSPAKGGDYPDMSASVYRNAGLDFIVRYEFFTQDQRQGIRARIYDVKAQKEVLSRSYTVARSDRYPFLAHHLTIDFADRIGVGGLEWMGRFVIFSRNIGPKETEILISDYTLSFKQVVVRGGFNVFPKWASDEQQGFYYTHYHDKPTLYHVDLYTGERTRIVDSDGMLACSDVSQDGQKLLLTMAPDDQADIYEYDLKSGQKRQLTYYGGIDVNGHYVENDRAFLFVTDRLGYPEIFYARTDNPRSASQFVYKGRNNNYINTWGNYAVFVSRDTDSAFADNTFNLYLISTTSDFIRQLTTTGKNNFPRFAPSGDTILHTKEYRNESALGIIRLSHNKSFLFPLDVGTIQAIDW